MRATNRSRSDLAASLFPVRCEYRYIYILYIIYICIELAVLCIVGFYS
jgi:hypothetical protein